MKKDIYDKHLSMKDIGHKDGLNIKIFRSSKLDIFRFVLQSNLQYSGYLINILLYKAKQFEIEILLFSLTVAKIIKIRTLS